MGGFRAAAESREQSAGKSDLQNQAFVDAILIFQSETAVHCVHEYNRCPTTNLGILFFADKAVSRSVPDSDFVYGAIPERLILLLLRGN